MIQNEIKISTDYLNTSYDEALAIYRMLAIRKSDTFNSDVALTLNNQANLHAENQYLDKAEQEYIEALEICRRLAEKSLEAFESDMAAMLNNLANLHSDTQRFNEAGQELEETIQKLLNE